MRETENLTNPELLTKLWSGYWWIKTTMMKPLYVCFRLQFLLSASVEKLELSLISLIRFNQKIHLEEGEKKNTLL